MNKIVGNWRQKFTWFPDKSAYIRFSFGLPLNFLDHWHWGSSTQGPQCQAERMINGHCLKLLQNARLNFCWVTSEICRDILGPHRHQRGKVLPPSWRCCSLPFHLLATSKQSLKKMDFLELATSFIGVASWSRNLQAVLIVNGVRHRFKDTRR